MYFPKHFRKLSHLTLRQVFLFVESQPWSRFTGRAFISPLGFCRTDSVCRSCSWALSGDRHLVQSYGAEIFFQDGSGAVKRGNGVRGSSFVVIFVAGVLPLTVTARCLRSQPGPHLVAAAAPELCLQSSPDRPAHMEIINGWSARILLRLLACLQGLAHDLLTASTCW